MRTIDKLCPAHRSEILTTHMWPADRRDCRVCLPLGWEPQLPGVDLRDECAYHEAGHAFVYLYGGIEVIEVSLASDDRFAAHTSARAFHPESLTGLPGLSALWAGQLAARRWLSQVRPLTDADQVDLVDSARSDTLAIRQASPSLALIGEARDFADRLIVRHWEKIHALAGALIKAETLTGEEIDSVVYA